MSVEDIDNLCRIGALGGMIVLEAGWTEDGTICMCIKKAIAPT